MKIFGWIKEYLKVGTPESSMRLVLIWSMVLTALMFLILAAYVIIQACFNRLIDWNGITLTIASLTAFMTTFLYFKKSQSIIENK